MNAEICILYWANRCIAVRVVFAIIDYVNALAYGT